MRHLLRGFALAVITFMTTLASAADPLDAAPTESDEIVKTLLSSVLDIWVGFLEHLPYIGVAVLVLLVTWIISAIAQRIARKVSNRSSMRKSLGDLLVRMLMILIWTLGLLLSAMVLFPGLTPAKALGGLGLMSVAVGLAFKDIFENFFAGILLLWKFPFEEGDFIECEGLMGRVVKVAVRNTTLRKTSGELVVVPNAFLFKNPVDVLTDRPKRRVTIMAGVAYDEDVAESVSVIEKAVTDCESVLKNEPIQIFPQGFGASSIDIEVTWWTKPTPLDERSSRGEVVTAMKKALDDAGIEIPFPYRTLTFKEPLPMKQVGNETESD